jgi:predicted Rossmann fold nucleotide-binding protein DprA/Smf involved in DNA uptake
VHLVEAGALAIVGSRHVDDMLIQYTEEVGQLAGKAGQAVVSGGARGVDQAAMRGALRAGGKAIGVLADSLERAALNRDNRDFLMDERLVLISPYDPAAGFNVGHAMQRNKLIYALAETALVVNSDFESGGTWAGAVEQLERWHFVPIYVRSDGVANKALDALLRKGALPWPNPRTPEALAEALSTGRRSSNGTLQQPQLAGIGEEEAKPAEHLTQRLPIVSEAATLAAQLFARVRELLSRLDTPKTETEIAADLQVSKSQAKQWLQRLVREGTLEKVPKPTRYRSPNATERLL